MDIRYVAGLFDGEGYVRIAEWKKPNSTHTRYQVIVGIGMTHKPVIEGLAKMFKGSLQINDHSKRKSVYRAQFFWTANSQNACDFLRLVLPHLIVKKDQALLALELQANIDEHKHRLGFPYLKHPDHANIWAYRKSLADQVKALKHVRFSVSDDPIAQ